MSTEYDRYLVEHKENGGSLTEEESRIRDQL